MFTEQATLQLPTTLVNISLLYEYYVLRYMQQTKEILKNKLLFTMLLLCNYYARHVRTIVSTLLLYNIIIHITHTRISWGHDSAAWLYIHNTKTPQQQQLFIE